MQADPVDDGLRVRGQRCKIREREGAGRQLELRQLPIHLVESNTDVGLGVVGQRAQATARKRKSFLLLNREFRRPGEVHRCPAPAVACYTGLTFMVLDVGSVLKAAQRYVQKCHSYVAVAGADFTPVPVCFPVARGVNARLARS
jgi:hypothetical protein